MIKLKYRIIKLEFPTAKESYVAQYKILGIWMNMGTVKNYFFLWNTTIQCNTYEEALFRIVNYELNIKRAKEWGDKTIKVVYNPAEL